RVAIGRRFHHRLHGDIAARARPVIDDELLAEALRQPLADQPRIDVVRAARREADDDAHRAGRIGLRPHGPRPQRQRPAARGQTQELPTAKCHGPASCNNGYQSGFAPENLTTLLHFSVSSAMSLPNAAGEPGNVVPPRSANRALAPGSARIALISLLSRSMI